MLDELYKISIEGILQNCKSTVDNCLCGTIIASPSAENPPYFFHWTRDAALTALLLIRLLNKLPEYNKQIYDVVSSYVFHEIATIQKNNLEYYAEPKYYVNGNRYDKPWGRPQNDGPAIRGYALVEFAFYQLKSENTRYIKEHLVDFNKKTGIIYQDFEFICSNYDKVSFDVWEEINGHHYFTSEFHYQFIKKFSQLASIFGDNETVHKCQKLMVKMRKFLDQFYTNENKWLSSTNIQNNDPNSRQWQDFANILAYNYCNLFWNPNLNSHIGPTINKIAQDNLQKYGLDHGIILFGRYMEDKYYDGPCWILLTIGFAQWLKRVNKMIKIDPTIKKSQWFQKLLEIIESTIINDNTSIDNTDFNYLTEIYNKNLEKLLKNIIQKNNGLHESFNHSTLQGISAHNLTWSYAAYLHHFIE